MELASWHKKGYKESWCHHQGLIKVQDVLASWNYHGIGTRNKGIISMALKGYKESQTYHHGLIKVQRIITSERYKESWNYHRGRRNIPGARNDGIKQTQRIMESKRHMAFRASTHEGTTAIMVVSTPR